MNSSSCQDGSGGRRCSSWAPMGRRWRSRNNGPMGKGGGGMDEMRGVGGGRKIRGEERQGCQWGASCLASLGGTCSWRGVASNCNCGGDNGNDKGGGTRTRSLRISPMCGGKRRERIEMMPKRWEDNPL